MNLHFKSIIILLLSLGCLIILYQSKILWSNWITNYFTTTKFNEIPKNSMNKLSIDRAKEYVKAFAESERSEFIYGFKTQTGDRFRGIWGSAEFEYNESSNTLIARWVVDKDFKYVNDIWLSKLNDKLEIYKGENIWMFDNCTIEFDNTAGELQAKYPLRLNLKIEITTDSLSNDEFIELVDQLTTKSFKFSRADYYNIIKTIDMRK